MAATSQAPVSGSPPGTGAIGFRSQYLGEGESILHVDSKVANRIFDLAMAEQDLNGAKVASSPVDYRRLRSAKRVRAILASHETAPGTHSSTRRVLAGAEMPIMINPAGKT